jgi:hypothetical protein
MKHLKAERKMPVGAHMRICGDNIKNDFKDMGRKDE